MDVTQIEATQETYVAITTSNESHKGIILNEISEALRTSSTVKQRQGKQPSFLLTLPAELRSAIYKAALLGTDDDLSLLYTCKQIYMEATPALYQRPVNFSSQAQLASWVGKSAEADLKRVTTLTLKLTDIEMSSLFDAGYSSRASRATAWSLYKEELESLDRAFQWLPGLRHLAIIPPEKAHSQLLKAMYLSFLDMIPARIPSLSQLTIHDDECVLNKAPGLKQLSDRVRVLFDTSKMPMTPESPARKQSTDTQKSSGDLVMVDGVAIKTEMMDTD